MQTNTLTARTVLINAGVKNLQEFGYPHCNAQNILTDLIYKAFFKSMLEDNLFKSPVMDLEIHKLLEEVDPEKPAATPEKKVPHGRRKAATAASPKHQKDLRNKGKA